MTVCLVCTCVGFDTSSDRPAWHYAYRDTMSYTMWCSYTINAYKICTIHYSNAPLQVTWVLAIWDLVGILKANRIVVFWQSYTLR